MASEKLDRFTQKKIEDHFKKTHLDGDKVNLELATEFGMRVRYAQNAGLSRDVAIESCRQHYKIDGKAMLDLADNLAQIAHENVPLENKDA